MYAKFVHELVTGRNDVLRIIYDHKKWREIPVRYLQHRLQPSNNGVVSAMSGRGLLLTAMQRKYLISLQFNLFKYIYCTTGELREMGHLNNN